MESLVASGVALGHGPNLLAEHVDLTVVGGRAIGLVGPNGAGKSTLLRVLAGIEPPLRGEVRRSPRTSTIGYLEQLIDPATPQETMLEWLSRRTGVADATVAMEAAAVEMATGDPAAADRYSDSLEQWVSLGGGDFADRAAIALSDVGLATDSTITVASLSGGQRARLGLASLIVARHDFHLLDEPTNDLDLSGLARMERLVIDELSRGAGVVVVSHDRVFLEAVATDIVELDPLACRARMFSGGYAAYVREREIARHRELDAFDDFRSRRTVLESRARTTREWSERGVRRSRSELNRKGRDPDKIGRRKRAESAERQAAKASQLDRVIERLDVVAAPRVGWQLRYSIEVAPRSGTIVATLRNATAARGSFRLGPIDLDLVAGARVAITGPNGAGKSTLLSLLLGRLEPITGTVTRGSGVVVGEIDQARASIDGDRSLLESFLGWYPTTSIGDVRNLLAKFDLTGDDVLQPAHRLSPGERTRATLARFQHDGVNLLVLDEPTNHLDLPAIEQLEAALNRYSGTLLLVSHDRRLLETVRVDHLWHVDAGRVTIR